MSRITYYHILGVSSDATDDEIAAAFRKKVKQWHPDICRHPDAEERMREINEAAEILCDPERRARYDRALAGKDTFEYPVAASAREETSRHKGWAALLFRFGERRGTIRYAATGCAALVILGIIIAVAVAALPFLSGSSGTPLPDGTAKEIPVPAVSVQDTGDLMEEGDRLFTAEDYEGALAAYNLIIAQEPSSADRNLWYNRGFSQNALGQYAEAAESFDQALRIAPDDSFALAQKGAALIGLGRYEESLHYTDLALNGGSGASWIWNNRGIALSGLGQQKEAMIAFENANTAGGITRTGLYKDIILKPVLPSGF